MATAHADTRRPRRAKRVRYTYDSDSDVDLSTPPRSQPSRQSRTTRPAQSYREETDDSDDNDFDGSEDEPVTATQSATQNLPRSQTQNSRRRKRPTTRSSRSKNVFELFKKRKPNTTIPVSKSHITIEIPPGHIPPWQTLPYHVLVNIMKFASYPFYGKASREHDSINWLLHTSRLCKAFHEACTAALLYSPPLFPSWRAHGLLGLLRRDPETTTTNYRNLIKCLDMEVKNLLVRKSGIVLEDLLSHTPLLQKLRLYHNHDDITTVWALPSAGKGRKWFYPEGFADMLDSHNIQFTSFEWNGRFASPIWALNTMKSSHNQASFRKLQHLTFLNLTYPDKSGEAIAHIFGTTLLDGLNNLPDLNSLTFRNCDLLADTVMSRLPAGLTNIEISQCSNFTSDNLSLFLAIKGSSLHTLRLIGNQSMSLGFLPSLKAFCPALQNLYVDLTYVDPTSYADRDPLYDELLPNGQPTWPSTLVSIDLEYLRQFSATDADGFFTSLVDAAPELPHLKRLSIKAIVNTGWRDRAQMRQKWQPKLSDVFLCSDEPQPTYLPVRSRKVVKLAEAGQKEEKSGRRSGRLAEILTRREESEESDATSSFAASVRSAGQEKQGNGTCSVVELTLSDQRPAQEQYREADFLDEEISGDEDFRA